MENAKKETLAIFGGTPVIGKGEFAAPWPVIGEDDIAAVVEVLRSGKIWGTDGKSVTALAAEWARYCGTKFCAAHNSGTGALHAALRGCGVEAGDEVIVPAYSFLASAACVLHQNALPVFADIRPDTYTIDPAKIAERITPRTRAIMVVHLFGLCADIDEINALARQKGLKVVEDACQAHGAEYNGRKAGSLADAAGFSLNGSKNLPAGEGGLFTTSDEEVFDKGQMVDMLVNLASRESRYPRYTLGYNYRYYEIPAALALSQLRKLGGFNAMRRRNCEALTRLLSKVPHVIPPTVPPGRTHVYHMYRVRFDLEAMGATGPLRRRRTQLEKALQAEGVACGQWMTETLPEGAVFRIREGYGHGYPWTIGRDIVYRPEEYPAAIAFLDTTTQLYDVPTMTDPAFADKYAAAFDKVIRRAADVFARVE